MRKILLSIILILFLVLAIAFVTGKIGFGDFRILGVTDIKEDSQILDQKLLDLSKVTSTIYPQKRSELDGALRNLNIAKTSYEEKASYSSDQELALATKHQIYQTEHLWVNIGNHATKEGINVKIDPRRSSTGAVGAYDLEFTAIGKYTGISDFVAALENDSELEFIIENFKIVPIKDSANLSATFLVRNVTIDIAHETPSNMTTITDGNTKTNQTLNEQVDDYLDENANTNP